MVADAGGFFDTADCDRDVFHFFPLGCGMYAPARQAFFIPVSRTRHREISDAVRAEMEGDEDYEPILTIPALERFKQRAGRLGIEQ